MGWDMLVPRTVWTPPKLIQNWFIRWRQPQDGQSSTGELAKLAERIGQSYDWKFRKVTKSWCSGIPPKISFTKKDKIPRSFFAVNCIFLFVVIILGVRLLSFLMPCHAAKAPVVSCCHVPPLPLPLRWPSRQTSASFHCVSCMQRLHRNCLFWSDFSGVEMESVAINVDIRASRPFKCP